MKEFIPSYSFRDLELRRRGSRATTAHKETVGRGVEFIDERTGTGSGVFGVGELPRVVRGSAAALRCATEAVAASAVVRLGEMLEYIQSLPTTRTFL